jgi:drug/metabolite transporter (DMT)-like permease
MQLPFTTDQFNDVFRAYNESVWPAQLALLALALLALTFVAIPRRWSGAVVSAVFATLWLWMALAYHLAFFTAINPLAYAFAAVTGAGGLVFLWQGVVKRRLEFRLAADGRGIAGMALVVFALVVYPAWSRYAGHRYPALPTFGLPCPTTIFTIGMLAFLCTPHPRSPLVAPVAWCLVGGQAAFLLNVPQDLGLLAAALVGVVLLWRAKESSPPAADLGVRPGL